MSDVFRVAHHISLLQKPSARRLVFRSICVLNTLSKEMPVNTRNKNNSLVIAALGVTHALVLRVSLIEALSVDL